MTLEVIILAAGKGSRMFSSTPKVLHTIAGKSMLSRVIDTARELAANKIHVVVGHGQDVVREQIQDQDINWVVQNEQLGTGHAVLQAMPSVNERSQVLIMYGDVPLLSTGTLQKLTGVVDAKTLALLTVNLENPEGYGRIVRKDNVVRKIIEQKDASENELGITEVNTGILAVNASHLKTWLPKIQNKNNQNEYYLTDIIEMAVNENIDVFTEQPESYWEVMGVNNRLQQNQLERYVQQEIAKKLMSQGLQLADINRFDCRGTLSVGRDVYIDVNCIFSGHVKIGDNVTIESNCVISDSEIGNNVHIKANSVIDNSTVKNGCDLGPFARLRPGTVLESDVRIGNFVEVKNATLLSGAKANHLAYIGDASVGAQSNIGAGTIFCNYDGANKHKTILGDRVFIGSNSTLVAPIEIEDDAFVGAGSTITKNVSRKNLAIARGRQKNIEGWKKPVKGQ